MVAVRPVRCALIAATALAAGCGASIARERLPVGARDAAAELGIVLLANTALGTEAQLELAAGLLDSTQEPRAKGKSIHRHREARSAEAILSR